MKIAFYCDSLSRGGAERVTCILSKYINKSVHCDIVTSTIVDNEYKVPNTVNRIFLLKNRKTRLQGLLKLRNVIKKNKYDYIIVMGVSNCTFVYPSIIGTKCKMIVSERNDPKHFSGKIITKIISNIFFRFAAGYVFQTKEAAAYYNLKGNEYTIIKNPVEFGGYPNKINLNPENYIINVGRLTEQKNQMLLIDTYNEVKDEIGGAKLYIFGEGHLKSSLMERIAELGLEDKIILKGNVANIHEYLYSAKAFVLSSDYEGVPNALIEAMALGLVCISTNCSGGGPKSLIENGKNGFLVQPQNAHEIASKMIDVINNYDSLIKLRTNAMQIRKKLCAEEISTLWIDYLRKIG